MASRTLDERTGARLAFKCESFQKTGSFKPRGALHKVLTLTGEARARGIVTVSAGNHAQAVAWASLSMGAPCVVVMPSSAPRSKLDAVRGYGAEVVLHDDRATLFDRLREVERERGLTFVHPFDDERVIAGQGTVGLEIVDQCPDADAVLVPVGGGGLIAGVALAGAGGLPFGRGPGMGPALAAGKPVPAPRPAGTLADGMTPPFVGELPLAIARDRLDGLVTVSEQEIAVAMRWLMTRAKLVVEGAGAAATAALLAGRVPQVAGASVVSIVSGGNVDAERLEALSEPAAA